MTLRSFWPLRIRPVFFAALVAARQPDAPKITPDAAVRATVAFGLRPDGGLD
jgi:hypothetical protein